MQLTLRHLFAFTLVAAVGCWLLVSLVRFQHGNAGTIADREAWPKPYAEIATQLRTPEDRISVFGLNRILDYRSVTRIEREPEFVNALIGQCALVPATVNHPMAAQLMSSVPSDWNLPDYSRANWYATPGFGTKHIEVRDLFLVCTDPKRNITLILHNNNF